MKKLLLSLGLGILSFAGFSQVQLSLTGACPQYAGSYGLVWADDSFWDGSGGTQSWNTPNMLITANAVTADLVLVEGVDPTPHGNCTFDMACSGAAGITNAAALAGNIAVIRRGSCEFGSKALAAQNAGAIACLIVNAVGDPIGMNGGTNGGSVTIPTAMVSANTGAVICDAIAAGCPQAFFGNIAGYYNDNLSCTAGDVYRPGRAMDLSGLYQINDATDIYSFTPGALVTNLGINSQTGITVTCEIFEVGNPTAIYSETSPAFDLPGVTVNAGIPAADNNWVSFTTPFTSTATDMNYEFVYTVNTPNLPDATPEDNATQSYFGLSPNKLALAQIDPNTNMPFATGGAGPRTDGTSPITDYWEICVHMSDANTATKPQGTWFQAYTYSPTDPNTTLLAKTVICNVYEWTNYYGIYDMTDPGFTTDVTNDTNKFTPITSATYFYQGDYQDSLIYVPYDNQEVVLNEGKHYLFCNRVETNGDVTTLTGMNFRLDAKTDYTITNGAFWDATAQTGVPSSTGGAMTTAVIEDGTFYSAGYGFDNAVNSIIDFNVTTTGVEEVENNRELIAYPNPAVDMITVPFGNATGNATINIVDVAGRTVSTQVINLTGGNVAIDVTELESGMYTFNVNYADGSNGEFKVVIAK
jgi:hypothetical protein